MGNKKKDKIKKFLPTLFLMLIGVSCGIFMVEYMRAIESAEKSAGEMLLSVGILFIGMYIAIFLQIIIHEAGHLLFGLMTGYRFSSFRVGSFMWVKAGGKVKLRRLSLAGTGGQCLLIPPEIKDGKFPYVLCNLGGAIINLVSGLLFAGLALLTNNSSMVSQQFVMLSVVGVAYALLNGFPLKLATVNNDGHNAISLGKNKEALRSFWIQLKVNEQITEGIRLKDMPDEWFEVPSEESMKNSMIAVMGVFACNRLMDQMQFEKLKQTLDKLLKMDTGIAGLHRYLLVTDEIYCELIGENRSDNLQNMLDKNQKKFMKAMKNFPSVLRTEYAYALLAEKDNIKASEIKESFEKMSKKYPHPSEIVAEQELMVYAESLSSL